MGRLSGMEISSSPGLKIPPKLAHRRPGFFPPANFWGIFKPRDEEIFIPDNHGPFGNCIPVRVNQAIFLFFLVTLDCHLTSFLMCASFLTKICKKTLKKLVKPQQIKFCPCRNQISVRGVMWKSDFRMGGHAEIWFLFSSAMTISRIFWCMEICQWPSLILTHTGI